MAYKFQFGAATMSGALTQEGALTSEGLASLDGGIDVNASQFTVSDAGAVVAESSISGAAGTFDALAGTSLALQSGGISAAGAIAGASSVSGSGLFSMSAINNDGVLDNEGAANIVGKLSVTAVSDLDGGIDVNASNFTVSSAGAITAASNATIEGIVSGAAGTFDALAGTSLALQSGGISAAGAIAGASSVSGSGLFSMSAINNDGVLDNEGAANIVGKLTVTAVSDLDGGIDVNASNFTVSAAGAVVAESSVSGAAGTFDALAGTSLALQSGGISAAGAIAGASTIDASGIISGSAALKGLSLFVDGVEVIDQNAAIFCGGIDNNDAGITNAGAVSQVTTLSGSSNLSMGGEVYFEGVANAAPVIASDSIYYLDVTDGLMKRMSMAEYATAIAGPGLTATNGQLSSDAAAAPNAIGDVAAGLSEGFNYGNATLTSDRIWTMPATPSDGDVVRVKAPAIMGGNAIVITGAGSQTIDGQTSMELESSFGAVSFVYVDTDTWRIF